jgi:hypothetical protein
MLHHRAVNNILHDTLEQLVLRHLSFKLMDTRSPRGCWINPTHDAEVSCVISTQNLRYLYDLACGLLVNINQIIYERSAFLRVR